ncbi:MAG: hypothetical protein Q9192_007874 [Flavoplaca navasiana]
MYALWVSHTDQVVAAHPSRHDNHLALSTHNDEHTTHVSSSYPNSNFSAPDVHPSLIRRHNQLLSMLLHRAPADAHAKRSLATILASGVKFILTHFDFVVATYIEATYYSNFYRDIIAKLPAEFRLAIKRSMAFGDPAVVKIVVTYGVIKLVAAYVRQEGVTDEVMEIAILQFSEFMLDLTRYVGVVLPLWMWAVVNGIWIQIRVFVDGFDQNLLG